MDKKIMIAPVQGHTDAAWRHFHHEVYGGENLYFTPFIRCERGDFRQHDLKAVSYTHLTLPTTRRV